MRIIQVINNLNTGGAEKLLLETIPLYREKGVEMDILVIDGHEYPFMKELKKMHKGTIFSLSDDSNIYNPLLIFKIMKFLKQYDIVHVHLFPAIYWVAFAKLLSFSKVKLVYTEHSTTNRRRLNTVFKVADRFIYGFYHKIICISKDVEVKIKKHLGFSDDRFELINNGLDIAKIFNETPYAKTELGLKIKEDDILLMQVSRFHESKDQPTLISALKHLPKNVHLLLVGEGSLKKDSETVTAKLELTNRVHFLGSRMDVLKLLKTVDIVVLSSHYEGLSLSSIEGLASGKPFIASDVQGLSEIVSGAGVLFTKGDDAGLASIVKALIESKDYYNEIVSKCLMRAKMYDVKLMVDKHIELYKSTGVRKT